MPSLYDHLNSELSDDEPTGITPLEIADLPPDQRSIMLALLRDQTATANGVPDAALRSRLKVKVANFDEALHVLGREGWIVISGEAPNLFYRVNFRPKRSNNSGFGLWSVLSDRVSPDKPNA
jgi:hypothetical protein